MRKKLDPRFVVWGLRYAMRGRRADEEVDLFTRNNLVNKRRNVGYNGGLTMPFDKLGAGGQIWKTSVKN